MNRIPENGVVRAAAHVHTLELVVGNDVAFTVDGSTDQVVGPGVDLDAVSDAITASKQAGDVCPDEVALNDIAGRVDLDAFPVVGDHISLGQARATDRVVR